MLTPTLHPFTLNTRIHVYHLIYQYISYSHLPDTSTLSTPSRAKADIPVSRRKDDALD